MSWAAVMGTAMRTMFRAMLPREKSFCAACIVPTPLRS